MTDTTAGMPAPSPGRESGRLALAIPWLAPDAAALTALARAVPNLWQQFRHDHGLVLLLLRCGRSLPHGSTESLEALCRSSTLPLLVAFRQLELPPAGILNPAHPSTAAVRAYSLTLAATCEHLARLALYPHPERAWCAGLLAPLGQFAACAFASPDAVALGAAARRLARRWNLPGWLAGVVGHLELSCEQAPGLVEDVPLFALTRLAVALVRRAGLAGGFGQGADQHPLVEDIAAEERMAGLRLDDVSLPPVPPVVAWSDPYQQPLLRPLLEMGIEIRRLRGEDAVARLECQVDQLHRTLRQQREQQEEAVRVAKLAALAEFAAGAGHEINNPLAVISGQAQYILAHESDWLASDEEGWSQDALGKIIQQTRRIHNILRELMQFARPLPPNRTTVNLISLIAEVAAQHAEQAQARHVRVDVDLPQSGDSLQAHVDANQVKTALGCLLRNAIEAAPPQGWARLSVFATASDVEVHVEDSGPGPRPEQRAHLFDPFYSGRDAGRGKGLGLPVAWRLVRQQGGDVLHVPTPVGQPTRFTLRLPRLPALSGCAA